MSGYAAVFGATSGLSGLSGYDRSVPAEYRGPLDQRVGTAVAMATMVGLMARERTDGAVHVDVAAQEVGTALIGDQLLEWQQRGCVDEPLGNHHALHAPHNVYQCLPIEGEQAWLALAIESDEQWGRLAERLDDWRLDPRWDVRARKAQEPTIDATISDWTRERERDELVDELQQLGIAAAPSTTARDLYEDRHVRARGMWSAVEHAKMGRLEVLAMPWLINGARIALDAAPTLGEDDDHVYRELLGVSADEQTQLVEAGVAY
jgi:crotonobetainyl-CoA:carnitine CoA-transferase CaiB-like acyl-CoA transferase